MRLVSVRSRVRTSLEAVHVGVVGNISACHADAPGSIPGRGDFFLFWWPGTIFRAKTQLLCYFLSLVGFLICNKQSSMPNASIAQLAEHLLRKEKVTSSILVGGWQFAWSSWL